MGARIVLLSAALPALFYADCFLPQALHAEEAPAPLCRGNLLAQAKWLRLEVVGGRIVARSDRCGQSRHVAEAMPTTDSRQTLAVESSARGLIVHYEEQTATSRLLLDVDERRQVTISRWAADTAGNTDVKYVQPREGKITLSVGGKTPCQLVAADLWQLLVVQRDACRAHLLPVLLALRSDWDLARQLEELESSLIAISTTDAPAQWQQWQQQVDGLAGPSYVKRQAADQALRDSGQSVLAFLRQLDLRELDSEQRRRVQSILADLATENADSPQRVAEWLISDKRVWLALMERGALAERIIATEHLSKLCRRPLRFDPQASPEQRTAQLAELAARLAQP